MAVLEEIFLEEAARLVFSLSASAQFYIAHRRIYFIP